MREIKELITELNSDLGRISAKNRGILVMAELKIRLLKRTLGKLRKIIVDNDFENQQEEILFFKKIKPQVFSQLIFNVKLFGLESKKPRRGKTAQIKYFKNQIDKLQLYFNDNLEFYQYLKKQSTYLDKQYFTRNSHHIRLHPETFYFFTDEQFSSSHDSTVATIMAYEELIEHLKNKITSLKNDSIAINVINKKSRNKLRWTGSKTDAIELIYALHASGTINNGNSDINELKEVFEEVFDMKIGNPYRIFINIRLRKINQTKLLDILKVSLLKYIENLDE